MYRKEPLWEAGVRYYHDDNLPDDSGKRRIYKPFTYRWTHKDGRTGTNVVLCTCKSSFERLLAHWNRTPDWRYTEEFVS